MPNYLLGSYSLPETVGEAYRAIRNHYREHPELYSEPLFGLAALRMELGLSGDDVLAFWVSAIHLDVWLHGCTVQESCNLMRERAANGQVWRKVAYRDYKANRNRKEWN